MLKTIKFKGQITQISAREFHTNGAATMKALWPVPNSLWCGAISLFWRTDCKCLREGTSATNVHMSQRY